jgi:hypothetical protein
MHQLYSAAQLCHMAYRACPVLTPVCYATLCCCLQVGISAYAPYSGAGLALNEFENAAFMFGKEMRDVYNIDVLGLINSGKLELQYSEFGLGGGNSYGGAQVGLGTAAPSCCGILEALTLLGPSACAVQQQAAA